MSSRNNNYLWNENSSLSESYSGQEIWLKANLLFEHVFTFYPMRKHIYDKAA